MTSQLQSRSPRMASALEDMHREGQEEEEEGGPEIGRSLREQAHTSQRVTGNSGLVETLTHLVDERDVERIIDSQRQMLARFEKSNEMLVNCNALALIRFEMASKDIRRHSHQLEEVRRDLDSVFRRIRFLRIKLSQQYPEAFKSCGNVFNVLDEEEELGEDSGLETIRGQTQD